jgi:hypothetical protein
MTRNRWTGLAGLLFGAVLFGSIFTAGTTPDSDGAGAAERYANYWSSDAHRTRALIAAMMFSYVFVLGIAFAAGLRDRLRSVDSGPLPSLVLAAGTAANVLLMAGAMLGMVIGITAKESSGFKVDGSTALLFDSAGYGMLAAGIMAAAVMTVVTGIVTLRTRVLPTWTAWLGFLVGLAALGNYFTAWIDFILLPLWSAVVGLVLLLRSDGPSSAEPAQSTAAAA